LNKIEEYSELYEREKFQVIKAVNEAIESFSDQIGQKGIQVECLIGDDLIVNANYSLVFSIFRNLMENSVNYAGENITITIAKYHDDNMFYYFSFSDNAWESKKNTLPVSSNDFTVSIQAVREKMAARAWACDCKKCHPKF